VLETGEINLEKRWLCSAKDNSVWVHRTVSGAPGWLWWTVHSRDSTAAYDYKSPDCPVVHRTVRWANGRPRNPRATRGRANGQKGAPDCPVCTGQCPVRQQLQDFNGRLCQNRKEIRTGQCPVVHWTVRCARRQKARIAFLECSQRLLAALGL
jgi:hypothetical protein